MLDWNISLVGVFFAVVFSGLACAAAGVMFGLAERRAGERKQVRILASLRDRLRSKKNHD